MGLGTHIFPLLTKLFLFHTALTSANWPEQLCRMAGLFKISLSSLGFVHEMSVLERISVDHTAEVQRQTYNRIWTPFAPSQLAKAS